MSTLIRCDVCKREHLPGWAGGEFLSVQIDLMVHTSNGHSTKLQAKQDACGREEDQCVVPAFDLAVNAIRDQLLPSVTRIR